MPLLVRLHGSTDTTARMSAIIEEKMFWKVTRPSTFYSDPPDLQVHLHSEDPRDLDALVRRYNTTLSKVIDCHAPLKTRTVKVRPVVPWYNDEIKDTKRLKCKAGGERDLCLT